MLFVVEGQATLTVAGVTHVLEEGGYAYLPPSTDWTLLNATDQMLRFHWIRKSYQEVAGLAHPDVIITNENDIAPTIMPDTGWEMGHDPLC